MAHSPLFQVMIAMQNTPMVEITLPGLTMTPMATDIETAKFDITLNIGEDEDGISLYWEYNTDLFLDATIQRLAGNFIVLLGDLSYDLQRPLAALNIFSPQDYQQLLAWNSNKLAIPVGTTVLSAFNKQVRQSPDEVAVVFGADQLTYRELDQRANQLGHYLLEQGVVVESLVAVYLERSLDLVVTLLAILKSGGAISENPKQHQQLNHTDP